MPDKDPDKDRTAHARSRPAGDTGGSSAAPSSAADLGQQVERLVALLERAVEQLQELGGREDAPSDLQPLVHGLDRLRTELPDVGGLQDVIANGLSEVLDQLAPLRGLVPPAVAQPLATEAAERLDDLRSSLDRPDARQLAVLPFDIIHGTPYIGDRPVLRQLPVAATPLTRSTP